MNYILKGATMDIFANAKSIALLKSCTTSSPYLSRLAMELAQYDFTLYHIDGTLNIVPDALSRMNKSHDDIISQDKTNNNAITKQKSLCLVEFLKLPTNYRFTPAEIKTMLTSEPLKTQIDKKISKNLSRSSRSSPNSFIKHA